MWIDKIEGAATCSNPSWSSYKWDIRWHKFNWRWTLVYKDWGVQEWYFYNWKFVAWKITHSNGDSAKWLWREKDENTLTLELWKSFRKSDGKTELGDFENSRLSYWMRYLVLQWIESYRAWNFSDWDIFNWYMIFPYWCGKFTNWNAEEITRTVTNTVYRDNGMQLSNKNPLWDYYSLWGKGNPYNVTVEFK